ncbi:succinate-semialdehyde dehydrogenase, mitochondrial [Brassica napus]|uniref:succinate-semialdehyde dehydrogenase, mitochondrial n=1 Tax=Brassica napus TaxID=3708 RepID=UPI0006AB544E|nr:succinate-semialdehyde dehydrogenase, mitochondrial [Brassica napus]
MQVGPALASGCTVVIKPSQLMPLTALAAAEFALQAGAPVREFSNHLCVLSDICIFAICSEENKVHRITAVGKKLMAAAASTARRNSGQTCVCIYDKFAEAFSEAVQKLEVGDGFKEGTPRLIAIESRSADYWNLVSSSVNWHIPYTKLLDLRLIYYFAVESFVQDAVSNRAKIILGGKRHSLGMTFYEALLEEIFGPVAPLIRFITEKEAIRIANDTIAGGSIVGE